ncbi:hypothetical protein AAZX31_14G024200 [Glycine max]
MRLKMMTTTMRKMTSRLSIRWKRIMILTVLDVEKVVVFVQKMTGDVAQLNFCDLKIGYQFYCSMLRLLVSLLRRIILLNIKLKLAEV